MSSAATPAPPPAERILFEAVCTPAPSLNAAGLRLVGWLVAGMSAGFAALFVWLGAWPVVGFFGAEVALVLGLLLANARRSRRPPELVRLVGDRVEAGGVSLAAYWTRVDCTSPRRGAGRLLLRDRGRVVEIGRALGEAARHDLAAALRLALAAYRDPRFENRQLRALPPGSAA